MLQESADSLLARFHTLEVVPVAAEYAEGMRFLQERTEQAKLVLWLGSSIGNFTLEEAARFLEGLTSGLNPTDRLLIGAEAFAKASTKAGNECRIVTYEDQGHGFFNKGRGGKYYDLTVAEMDKFLAKHGFLTGAR